MERSGRLWIGAHPKLLKYLQHVAGLSPAPVLHIVLLADAGYDVGEVYWIKGEEISGSSVAAVHINSLLIGAVVEPRFSTAG